jgi:TatD DNase family protein
MDFIDTHAHLYAEEFDSDRVGMLQRCIDAGVNKVLLPNIDSESIPGLMDLVGAFPDNCYAMMGLHPCSVKENYPEELGRIKEALFSGFKYIGVGEVGIDLYWDKSTYAMQRDAFITQCQWANELSLPLSIHTREATREAIDCLKTLGSQPGGVFHCFSGTADEAAEIIQMGYSLGIGGVITYKNSNLKEILKNIDLEYIVLETDAPYLSPVPFRGKRNESSYIPVIAKAVSEILNVPLIEVARKTVENARVLFKL